MNENIQTLMETLPYYTADITQDNLEDFAELIIRECMNKCHTEDGERMGVTTAMYYEPVYDKNGNNLNPDGNSTTGTVSCSVCKKHWRSVTQYGKTEFTEIVS